MSEKDSKKDILDTATKLFVKHGKNGVSTCDIAHAAGVNKALIFYYYGSKEKLYAAAFKNLIQTFFYEIREKINNSEPGLPAIEVFIRNHITIIKENQNMMKMLVRELLLTENGQSFPLNESADIFKSLRYEMIKVLSDAREKGEIRYVDPVQTMVSIISLDVFYFLGKPLVQMINPTIDIEDFESNRVDHIIDLLMNGLRKDQE
ncbi:MAG: TetR/AcrR family transcriptional regulator [Candidatus Latescibacteria bacterium]|nr:TetR/AcrR family transcriptional regulator [Candidatus Latescibacterota bacterium]